MYIYYLSYSLLFAASFLIISFIVCISIFMHICNMIHWYILISIYDMRYSAINKSLVCMHQFNDNNDNNDDDDDDDVSTSMTSTEKFISLCCRHTKCIYCLVFTYSSMLTKCNAILSIYIQIGFVHIFLLLLHTTKAKKRSSLGWI